MRGPVIDRRALLAGAAALGASLAGGAFAESTSRTIKSDDGRDVRISSWPAVGPEQGMILFSHGFFSSPEKYENLIVPWTGAGFSVQAPLHVDSYDYADRAKYDQAATWRTRLLDMRALSKATGKAPYVAAGHSFGALVALTLGGAEVIAPAGLAGPFRDPRAKAAVAFSPPGPVPTLITREGYGALAVPALIETGDKDYPAVGGTSPTDWRIHLTAFEAAKGRNTYGLVLPGVDHYFGGLICRPELPGPPQTEGLARALTLSTAFLKAYGLGDHSAKEVLRTAPDLLRKA